MILSKNDSDYLKGICTIAVLVHHLCSITWLGSQIHLGPIYTAMGYWSVSIFFLVSGYGLGFSFENKNKYQTSFLYNKIMPMYILQVFIIILYFVFKCMLTPPPPIPVILQSFLFGNTLVTNGWFLQVILIFYLFFFLAQKICNSFKATIIYLFIFIVIYMIVCRIIGLSTTWYETSLCFPIGYLLYSKRNCKENIKKFYMVSLIFLLSFFIEYLTANIIFKVINSISCAIFAVYAVRLLKHTQLPIIKKFSKYSLEVYLFQGLAFLLLRNNIWLVENHVMFYICSICVTLLLSIGFQPVIKRILAINKPK